MSHDVVAMVPTPYEIVSHAIFLSITQLSNTQVMSHVAVSM